MVAPFIRDIINLCCSVETKSKFSDDSDFVFEDFSYKTCPRGIEIRAVMNQKYVLDNIENMQRELKVLKKQVLSKCWKQDGKTIIETTIHSNNKPVKERSMPINDTKISNCTKHPVKGVKCLKNRVRGGGSSEKITCTKPPTPMPRSQIKEVTDMKNDLEAVKQDVFKLQEAILQMARVCQGPECKEVPTPNKNKKKAKEIPHPTK